MRQETVLVAEHQKRTARIVHGFSVDLRFVAEQQLEEAEHLIGLLAVAIDGCVGGNKRGHAAFGVRNGKGVHGVFILCVIRHAFIGLRIGSALDQCGLLVKAFRRRHGKKIFKLRGEVFLGENCFFGGVICDAGNSGAAPSVEIVAHNFQNGRVLTVYKLVPCFGGEIRVGKLCFIEEKNACVVRDRQHDLSFVGFSGIENRGKVVFGAEVFAFFYIVVKRQKSAGLHGALHIREQRGRVTFTIESHV